jgi:signal peptidase I
VCYSAYASDSVRVCVGRSACVRTRAPDRPEKALVRRLVALEGDTLRTRDDRWVLVPRGHAWVECDQPTPGSPDSYIYGPVRRPPSVARTHAWLALRGRVRVASQVPLGLVFARVPAVVWPPSRMRALPPAPPSPRVLSAERTAALHLLGYS